MSARLVDEEAAHVVEAVVRVAALVENRRTLELVGARGDDPEGLAGRVVVDRRDSHRRGSPHA